MPRFKDTTSRRDSKGRILKKGFSERKDGQDGKSRNCDGQ